MLVSSFTSSSRDRVQVQGTQHLPIPRAVVSPSPTCTCASSCMHLSPESWSANLVNSWLINQLTQGKDSTVKVYTYTTGHWWFIRYKKICCYYTSDHIILLIKNYSFYYLRWRNFTFPSYKSYKISHFPHLYHIQILQKHQITPFLYSVKKSLFLTFYHISVIFDRSIILSFSFIYQKSPFFTFFTKSPKITIFL